MRIIFLAFFTIVLVSCSSPTSVAILRDSVDMAYDAYKSKRNQCNGMSDPREKNACLHIAAEQMVGLAESYSDRWREQKLPNHWGVEQNYEKKQEVTTFHAPPYTPTLKDKTEISNQPSEIKEDEIPAKRKKQQGPTKEALEHEMKKPKQNDNEGDENIEKPTE